MHVVQLHVPQFAKQMYVAYIHTFPDNGKQLHEECALFFLSVFYKCSYTEASRSAFEVKQSFAMASWSAVGV